VVAREAALAHERGAIGRVDVLVTEGTPVHADAHVVARRDLPRDRALLAFLRHSYSNRGSAGSTSVGLASVTHSLTGPTRNTVSSPVRASTVKPSENGCTCR
jgi:hypothetical protein